MAPDFLEESRVAFAARLVSARKYAGLTQVELAEASGISQSHISHLEKGSLEPRLTTIIALADALNIGSAALIPDRRRKDLKPPVGDAEFTQQLEGSVEGVTKRLSQRVRTTQRKKGKITYP